MSTEMWDDSRVDVPDSGSPFAGRDAELGLLLDTLVALDTEGARTVLVCGEAGIGKTRLIKEFRRRARAAGALVASGVCTPAEGGGLPYGSVVGALRDLSRQLDEPTAAAILTPTRQRLGLDGDQATDAAPLASEMGKTQLFEALLDCFTVLAERTRVVVVLEDLHWADSASVEVIDFLARNLDASQLLLVGTHRLDEPNREQSHTRLLAELGRHRAVSQLELTGLDRDATAVLMGGILGRQPEWTLVDAVHARSDGNPFFAEELTAARDATTLPSVLRDVIMMRIDRLAPAARHVVAVVATAGGSVDHRLLAQSADLDAGLLDLAIIEAVDLHVLEIDERSRFRFRHGLQQEAVDDALLPTERARLHHKLAVALTANPELRATGPGHAAVELAEHWWEAGDWPEALPASIAAADAMVALLAMREAYAHYERAVSAYDRCPVEGARSVVDYVELLFRAAESAFLTGAPQRSVELIHLALAEFDEASDPRRAARCYTMLGRNAWANLDADGAFEAFERAAGFLSSEEPSFELARVLAEQARSLMLLARVTESEARCVEAITIARAVGAPRQKVMRSARSACASPSAATTTTASPARVKPSRSPKSSASPTTSTAFTPISRRSSSARDDLKRAPKSSSAEWHRANASSAFASTVPEETVPRHSSVSDAGTRPKISSATWTTMAWAAARPGRKMYRALLDTRRGRLDDAAAYLMADDALSKEPPTVQDRGALHMARAELLLEQEKPAAAFGEIEQALTIAAGTDDNTFRPEMCALGIRALADEHDTTRARGRSIDTDKFRRLAQALAEQAESHVPLTQQGAAQGPPRPLALLAWCDAEATRLHGPDPDQWEIAARRWDRASEPYHAAYCRWREAEATLAVKAGRDRATRAAQTAWQTTLEIGAPPLQARIESLARRARITLTPAQTAAIPSPRQTIAEDLGLTPRETEVLAQLVRGRTDRQIAEELYISKKTASVHVSNILRKLDATNRVDAAEIAQRAGLS